MAKKFVSIITTTLALLGIGLAWGAAPFVDNNNGTVTDTSTGLMWDKCSLGQSDTGCATGAPQFYNWTNAQAQAATLNTPSTGAGYKGYADWRLPGIVELLTLVKTGSNPTIDTAAFPNTPSAPYWSASPYVANAAVAWYVSFFNGIDYGSGKVNGLVVRLVRGGQCFGSFALLPVSVTATGAATATLTATSAADATGYWMVLPRGAAAPTPEQIKTPANYSAVTVAASGSAAMTAKTPKTFVVSGLTQGTAYDVYLVAQDTIHVITSCMAATQFSTPAISTRSIVIDPATPAKVYSALDGAGVYRSTDSGVTWTAATTQPANLNVRALVIKPANPATLFAASYGGGVFQSTDSAATWAACAAQPTNLNLLTLVTDATGRLYAGSEAGVFVSSNDCAAWSAMNTGLPN